MMQYKVIASSSRGNCTYINGDILVDVGISFSKIEKVLDVRKLKLILITHQHSDHLSITTLKKILSIKKKIKVLCNEVVGEILDKEKIKHNVIKINQQAIIKNDKLEKYYIEPFALTHDVQNFGYRVRIEEFGQTLYKVFYATDTGHLDGIDAKEYDYYFIESNYQDENLQSFDAIRVSKTHLSEEQCVNFYVMNKKETSELIRMHMSSRNW